MTHPWRDDGIAPNGRAVQANFHAWFGRSRVVADDGSPQPVYHGSRRSSATFTDGLAWFSETPGLACLYAMNDNWYGRGSNVIKAFLRVCRPLDLVSLGITADDFMTPAQFSHRTGIDINSDVSLHERSVAREVHMLLALPAFRRHALEQGFDGIRVQETDSSSDARRRQQPLTMTWAAFQATQIKSAWGNSGLFACDDASLTDERKAHLLLQARKGLQAANMKTKRTAP